MKVLLNSFVPFALAHGGAQIQINSTRTALEDAGIEAEPLRWWDENQRGDLIHFFGVPTNEYLRIAQTAKIPVVLTQLFTETCNRSDARLRRQGFFIKTALALPFAHGIKQQLTWNIYRNADHNVVGLEAERHVLQTVYGVPSEIISVVPLGLSENYLRAGKGSRNEEHLICTGTITERKNSVELAEMARAAETPILFVGKPYSETDSYWQHFKNLVDGKFVKHHPFVADEKEMILLLQRSRGFVLMSRYENWCLSAHEAVACGLPILVQDQKWSRERFGNQACYFQTIGFSRGNVAILKKFWNDAPALSAPQIKLHSWNEVAAQLKSVYEKVLSGGRSSEILVGGRSSTTP
ncbi:MAG TPA: glycosyltransferase [Verrucomicrobiae bacterium]|nr:glycosyltransferase [Verrucomicrobiae bacterium]